MADQPLILGFDTSAAHCAAALICGQEVLQHRVDPMERGQAEHLVPMLEEMLQGAGYGWRDLAAIGVGTGPGNFTGIRIAVSAARGLALSLGIPAVGVSAFEAAAEGLERPVLVCLDARRGMVYAQEILEDGAREARLLRPENLPKAERLAGDAAEEIARHCGGRITTPVYPTAIAIARRTLARHVTPGPRPAPLYLRAADAAPPSDPPPIILP